MLRFLLLFFSVLLLFSCQRQAKDQKAQQPAERRIVVSLYQVKSEEVPIEYITKGYFEGERDVILRPLVSGRVIDLFVDEGSFVRSGQALLKIDPADYENSVRQLEAQIAQARANYENLRATEERRRFLFERELIAREEYENIKTQLKAQEEVIRSLQAQLSNLKLNLQRTTLTAPFSGYIAQRFVNIGDYITPQSQSFRLVTLDPIRFVFQVPQEYLPYAKQGSKVLIKVEPFGDFEGKIFFISPTADANRLITIKAKLSNPEGKLKPSMYGEARLVTKVERAFAVPERSVVIQGNKKVVWRIKDGMAQPVEVEVIRQGEGVVYVRGDLKEGEGIALDNAYVLQQGMKVEVR
ncbi:MAG: efflux RND transporter periplasmic adaptor subunit [Aquificaceae bacterium]|nr:efflux RND transporter periplasmic adaptor subunit [Aquificaceae bacterium]MDW8422781.1 efflux RND transporter periplasmic adaptor subunit [Aquificaceae bacterium]